MDFSLDASTGDFFPQIRGFGNQKLIPLEQDSASYVLFKKSTAWAWG